MGCKMGVEVLKIRWNDLMGRYEQSSTPLPDGVSTAPSATVRVAK